MQLDPQHFRKEPGCFATGVAIATTVSHLDYVTWGSGCPILPDALANFECPFAVCNDGADHLIFVGEVTRMACDPAGQPLRFVRRRYADLAPPQSVV